MNYLKENKNINNEIKKSVNSSDISDDSKRDENEEEQENKNNNNVNQVDVKKEINVNKGTELNTNVCSKVINDSTMGKEGNFTTTLLLGNPNVGKDILT